MDDDFPVPLREFLEASEWVDLVVGGLEWDLDIDDYMDYCARCCEDLDCELWVWSGELCPGCDCDTVLEDLDMCEDEGWDYGEGEDWDEYLDTWE